MEQQFAHHVGVVEVAYLVGPAATGVPPEPVLRVEAKARVPPIPVRDTYVRDAGEQNTKLQRYGRSLLSKRRKAIGGFVWRSDPLGGRDFKVAMRGDGLPISLFC